MFDSFPTYWATILSNKFAYVRSRIIPNQNPILEIPKTRNITNLAAKVLKIYTTKVSPKLTENSHFFDHNSGTTWLILLIIELRSTIPTILQQGKRIFLFAYGSQKHSSKQICISKETYELLILHRQTDNNSRYLIDKVFRITATAFYQFNNNNNNLQLILLWLANVRCGNALLWYYSIFICHKLRFETTNFQPTTRALKRISACYWLSEIFYCYFHNFIAAFARTYN